MEVFIKVGSELHFGISGRNRLNEVLEISMGGVWKPCNWTHGNRKLDIL
jgi:hypothetical protein